MIQAFVCLGSNMGDAKAHLARAREAIAALPGVRLAAASSLYRTEPQGRKDQPWFFNQVLRLECEESMNAVQLLDALLEKEAHLGRVRDASDHFGPRVIDMDLILFGGEVRHGDEHLILPHPRMAERAFVLVPLLEIAPDLALPDGTEVKSLLEKLHYRLEGSSIFQ
ncbi:2-amino-4-hydroxy-6-hydroxymethyldihydropteridine diphosphokinase [Mailhella massiliensis]|uniref:2-amino-4-hydroxy-6-hydroxymethyldihydropteridine pyrophosphokinase n=1 Tax=Mailhella massiliensis TaxID=1903261 RepID=A0A921AYC7_9BACT|nr:2-amino-4-hydroxy-6-hydroxymethyldihydropteridine diphosphokinase [Mailhella massiliensis]HJD98378.1 2-amino-4-hydroxy-6-hydroxymethyldihydropteridine diphosphokinase [Mailhella massiliensis]